MTGTPADFFRKCHPSSPCEFELNLPAGILTILKIKRHKSNAMPIANREVRSGESGFTNLPCYWARFLVSAHHN